MVNPVRKIVIDNVAKIDIREAYQFIKKDSFQNADKVRKGILKSIKQLIRYLTKYPPDKFRQNKDTSFRAYEIFKYRITYHISEHEIRIIRIRHTKMNPLEY
jgi:plasmid stabilization system protein ParE